jgi:hypothetical protein
VALQKTEYGSPPGDLVNTHRLFASGLVSFRSSVCKAEQPRDLGYMDLAIIAVTNRRIAPQLLKHFGLFGNATVPTNPLQCGEAIMWLEIASPREVKNATWLPTLRRSS